MLTLEITIQRCKDKTWPVILTRTRTRDFLPVRTDASMSLDLEMFTQDSFAPDYGRLLGEAFFQGNIKDAYIGALGNARTDLEPLRLLLFIEADDLKELHWERLQAPMDGGWHSLSGNQQVLFSQYLPSTTDRRFPPIGRRDLRALVLVAAPADLSGNFKLADFDVAATVSGVRQSLGEIPCTVLASTEGPECAPTLDNLCRQITAEHYSILHIVCHGSYRSQDGETILFFPNETGRPVAASTLLERLEQIGGARGLPHLTFLSTCDSADPRAENGLGGLGHRLVRQLGMPVVVAMTEKVSIATAQALASAFYLRLREHGEADRALAESTAGLLGKFDLTVPALFTRIGGRPIFSDNLDRPLTPKEIAFGLDTLGEMLDMRAPVQRSGFDAQARQVRSTLGADVDALSPQLQLERQLALIEINQISVEVVEISFSALALGQQPPAYDARPPFRGLFPFRNDDKEFFFGREVLVDKLVRKVREHNFLAVLGPSGSGKSSLVLAGLIPALGQPNCYLTPNSDPLAQLDAALRHARPRSVIVVDQFEELFTLCSDNYRREGFIERLLELAKKQPVVITMRADFWGEVAPYSNLREIMQTHLELVAPMNATELRRAMDMQAGHVGLRFEADLSQDILDDVQDEPGAMPLLQHALLLLWNRRHGRWLRSEEYRNMGGIREAIARTADEVYEGLDERNRERMRDIFVRLTRLDASGGAGNDQRDTRRRVGMAELVPAGSDPAETSRLVKQLADARIIVTSVNAATRQEEVEVAHEALIRYWPRLRGWLDEDRVDLRLRDGVREAAIEWETGKRDAGFLVHRGSRLEDAEVLSRKPRFALNALELEYIKTCIDHRENEKLVIERRRRRTVIASLLAGLLMMLLGCYGLVQANFSNRNAAMALDNARTATNALGYAQIQAATAQAAQQTSEANAIEARNQAATATVALGMAKEQAATALAAQNEALRQAGIATSALGVSDQQKATAQSAQGTSQVNAVNAQQQAANAQTQAANAQTQAARATTAQGQSQEQAATAQAAKATANAGATISANNAATAVAAEATAMASNNLAQARALAAMALGKVNDPNDPDLAFLLASEAFRRLSVYETRNALLTVVQSVNNSNIDGFLSRPDGVTISANQPTFSPISLLTNLLNNSPSASNLVRSPITSLAINPAGTLLAAGQANGSIALWDPSGRKPLAILTGHSRAVKALVFSPYPGSNVLVSGSDDGKIISWDTASHAILGQYFIGDGVTIDSIAFSPNGQTIAANFFPNDMLVFSAYGTLILNISGMTEVARVDDTNPYPTFSLAFNPTGQVLATSAYGIISFWDTNTWVLVGQIDCSMDSSNLVFSPDGSMLASSLSDGTGTNLWDVNTLAKIWSRTDLGVINSMAFSPDGKILATAGDGKNINLLDAETGDTIANFTGHSGPINGIVFSPDGKTIFSGSQDTTIRLWKLGTVSKLTQSLVSVETYANDIAFDPHNPNHLAFALADGTARLWDVSTRNELAQFRQPEDTRVQSLAFSPIGSLLATGSGYPKPENFMPVPVMRLWNVATGQNVGSWLLPDTGDYNDIFDVAFSPDGQTLASTFGDGRVYIWSVASQSLITTSEVFNGPAFKVNFSPDGKTLAAIVCIAGGENGWNDCTSRGIRFWKLDGATWTNSGKALAIDWGGLTYSPDGKMIAVGSANNTVLLRDSTSLTQSGLPLNGHTAAINEVTFSPDGTLLVSGDVGMELRLWDLATHNQIGGSFPGWEFSINSTGTLLAYILFDPDRPVSSIGLLDINPRSWAAIACHVASRNFTRAEWAYYFPGETYQVTCAEWPAGN